MIDNQVQQCLLLNGGGWKLALNTCVIKQECTKFLTCSCFLKDVWFAWIKISKAHNDNMHVYEVLTLTHKVCDVEGNMCAWLEYLPPAYNKRFFHKAWLYTVQSMWLWNLFQKWKRLGIGVKNGNNGRDEVSKVECVVHDL